jgi:hypothetical protein
VAEEKEIGSGSDVYGFPSSSTNADGNDTDCGSFTFVSHDTASRYDATGTGSTLTIRDNENTALDSSADRVTVTFDERAGNDAKNHSDPDEPIVLGRVTGTVAVPPVTVIDTTTGGPPAAGTPRVRVMPHAHNR